MKDKLLHLALPATKKEACLVGLFGFWRQPIPRMGVLLLPHTWLRKLLALCGSWKRRLFNRPRLLCELLYHLNRMRRAVLVILEVSVQTGMLFGAFWGRALPSSADNYFPSERQLLACYWTLVKTECLTMGYRVSMQPDCPS